MNRWLLVTQCDPGVVFPLAVCFCGRRHTHKNEPLSPFLLEDLPGLPTANPRRRGRLSENRALPLF